MQQSDWDDLKEQMDSPYGQMALMCDGFRVDLIQYIEPGKRSWCTNIYVNDSIKGAWLSVDHGGKPVHDEARRFYRRSNKKLYSAAEIALHRKAYGKKRADELAAKVITSLSWDWSSFNSLKKHLQANNTKIERIH